MNTIFDAANTVFSSGNFMSNRIAYDILNNSGLLYEQGKVVCSYNTDTCGDVITTYPARKYKQGEKVIILNDRLGVAEPGDLFGYSRQGYERVFESK